MMNEGLDRRELLIGTAAALGLSTLYPALADADAAPAQAAAVAAAPPDSIEGRVERAEDAVVVENMIGTYPSLQHAGMYRDILAMFALKQPDVRVEIRDVGIWQGAAAVEKAVVQIPEQIDREFAAALQKQFPYRRFEPRSGRQFEMPIASGVIHVARDRKTAKGLWAAWGPQTGVGRDGKIAALFVAEKWAVDFIREDGVWKIWHFQIVPEFRTPYEVSWVETARTPAPLPAYYRGQFAPTRASKPVAHAYDPAPPDAYDTFAKTWSY